MSEDYWENQAIKAREHNEISLIRFGGFGAQGSTTWLPGQKLHPWQREKLEAILADEKPKPDNFEDMC